MTFASLASKYESSDEPESDLGLDGSRGLFRMKSSAPSCSTTADLQSQSYLTRRLAAASL